MRDTEGSYSRSFSQYPDLSISGHNLTVRHGTFGLRVQTHLKYRNATTLGAHR